MTKAPVSPTTMMNLADLTIRNAAFDMRRIRGSLLALLDDLEMCTAPTEQQVDLWYSHVSWLTEYVERLAVKTEREAVYGSHMEREDTSHIGKG
jgi:hypothetical protein